MLRGTHALTTVLRVVEKAESRAGLIREDDGTIDEITHDNVPVVRRRINILDDEADHLLLTSRDSGNIHDLDLGKHLTVCHVRAQQLHFVHLSAVELKFLKLVGIGGLRGNTLHLSGDIIAVSCDGLHLVGTVDGRAYDLAFVSHIREHTHSLRLDDGVRRSDNCLHLRYDREIHGGKRGERAVLRVLEAVLFDGDTAVANGHGPLGAEGGATLNRNRQVPRLAWQLILGEDPRGSITGDARALAIESCHAHVVYRVRLQHRRHLARQHITAANLVRQVRQLCDGGALRGRPEVLPEVPLDDVVGDGGAAVTPVLTCISVGGPP